MCFTKCSVAKPAILKSWLLAFEDLTGVIYNSSVLIVGLQGHSNPSIPSNSDHCGVHALCSVMSSVTGV